MKNSLKKIPYGIADIQKLLTENYYYVDKTKFIPLLEQAGDYLFFIRPRRFGKSLWIATLEYYYDVKRKKKIPEIFASTWISQNPTQEMGKYFILRFDFSTVDPDPEKVEKSFDKRCKERMGIFVRYYQEFLPQDFIDRVMSCETAHDMLSTLLSEELYRLTNHKVYVLIDEYDNFTNTILSAHSHKLYLNITHGSGFFRHFFNVLKSCTSASESSLGRLFVTGVSPITMDDVTSGFNIGNNLSLEPQFNTLLGFTESEVVELYHYYYDNKFIDISQDKFFYIATKWYNHYRFYKYTETSLFNPDMIFYFIQKLTSQKALPDKLIDSNVRIDYEKLKHLVVIDQRLNGNFSILQEIMDIGETGGEITDTFPLEKLLRPENFISHLYYFGLLSFKDQDTLIVPNETVWKLLFGYIRDAYDDLNILRINIWTLQKLLKQMAYNGKWQEVFEFLASEINNQTGIRDYIEGEHSIKLLLAAYINILDYFLVHTEKEANKGFADIYLEPFREKNERVKYGYLIELKYVKRDTKLTDALKAKLKDKAKKQLEQYCQDVKIKEKFSTSSDEGGLIKLYQLWHGWEMVEMEEIP